MRRSFRITRQVKPRSLSFGLVVAAVAFVLATDHLGFHLWILLAAITLSFLIDMISFGSPGREDVYVD